MTTDMEILNVPVVGKAIQERGLRVNWVVQQVGLNRSAGYQMFRYGRLPKDADKRESALTRLSEIIDLPRTTLVVRFDNAMVG